MRPHLVEGDRGQTGGGARHRMRVRVRAVDHPLGGHRGQVVGLVLELGEAHAPLLPQALHLGGGKVGSGDHVPEQRERRLQAVSQRREAGDDGVGPRHPRQLGAQRLDGLGQLGGGTAAGALPQHGRGQVGQTGAGGRLGGQAAAHDEADAHQRQLVVLRQHHPEAVGQRERLSRRELERRLGPGPGHDGPVHADGRRAGRRRQRRQRLHPGDQPPRAQIPAGRGHDRLGRQLEVALQLPAEHVGPAEVVVKLVDPVGHAAEAAQ